jgi:hypothetical protein
MADDGATPTSAELQRVVEGLPWPNVRGKRCLGIGPADWELDLELKRRGAAEVVTVDLQDHDEISALDPEMAGSFDVVVCIDLVRLDRDPLGALEAVRRVTTGVLLSVEPVELWTSVLARGRPLFTLHGDDGERRGFSFNGAGHKHLLTGAGFTVERVSRPFVVPSDVPVALDPTWRDRVTTLGTRVVTRSRERGRLHRALLARPTGAMS